jgi:site-specific DNA-methyltransferase (adenine-specific)
MWAAIKHVLKPRGVFVTTASQPFTSALVMSNPKWFRYEWVWNKKIPAGMSYARYQPMRQHENIIVFYDGGTTYNPQLTKRDKPIKKGGNNFSTVAPIAACKTGVKFVKTYDHKHPTTIIESMKARTGNIHPTQKPVALYEYLIRTYTNEGETVLDMTAGSGTTGVAAINTGRNVILIEQREDYADIARRRCTEATEQARQLAMPLGAGAID